MNAHTLVAKVCLVNLKVVQIKIKILNTCAKHLQPMRMRIYIKINAYIYALMEARTDDMIPSWLQHLQSLTLMFNVHLLLPQQGHKLGHMAT